MSTHSVATSRDVSSTPSVPAPMPTKAKSVMADMRVAPNAGIIAIEKRAVLAMSLPTVVPTIAMVTMVPSIGVDMMASLTVEMVARMVLEGERESPPGFGRCREHQHHRKTQHRKRQRLLIPAQGHRDYPPLPQGHVDALIHRKKGLAALSEGSRSAGTTGRG